MILWCLTSTETIRLVWDGRIEAGKRGILQTNSYSVTIRMALALPAIGSDESHFNASLIVRDKVSRHCPQTTTFWRGRIEPRPSCLPASVKPVLNWANVSSRTLLEVFGEASWFLIGPTFLRESSWKYSSKLYLGSKKLRSTCSWNIRPIRRSLPLIGWEQSSPVDEEKIKIKMDDGVARFFTRFGRNLFICWLVEGAALSRRPRMR